MTATTRATVEEFLQRLGDGDPDRIAALFGEPVDWRLDWPDEGHPAVPWIRPRRSRADVSDHFRTLADFHVPEKRSASIDSLIVEGAEAVLLGEISQTVRASGRAYSFSFALRLTVENSQITRFHLYEDSLTVANALS
ncbi:nuclear transport factor 2 family protein [Phytohabitans flavus]|uniref:Ketosteroid isomerase n=1 Tax=Phytohabitans flavus TaxID=1076124 RepID=A0A6F8XJ15_9ACTN|nr:nuclear transport factor 2 family protein [Phytohabitans flavus]BCB73788.1 ketosteroid isomerase [Phytohabitans flavus]